MRRHSAVGRRAALTAVLGVLTSACLLVSGSPAGATPARPAIDAGTNSDSTGEGSAAGLPDGQEWACGDAPAPGYAACDSIILEPTGEATATQVEPDASTSPLTPAQLRAAYNLPSGGSGMTVGIVDAYDDPTAESDLATFRSSNGLPACTTANGCFRKVNQTGATSPSPTVNSGWDTEISLDLQAVSSVCPDCHLLLVEATTASLDNLGTAENTAVALGAQVISNSYGGAEPSTASQAATQDAQYDSEYFDHPGVVVVASTDDDGYNGDGKPAQYPAVSPYVVAVGGTTLVSSPGARGWSETVWGSGGLSFSGTGSGCSLGESKPAWQTDPGCSNRMEADVAADANPNTGLAIVDGGSTEIVGGTSLAAPLIAGMWALAGPAASGDNPVSYPYSHPAAFNDVTSGSNKPTLKTCATAYFCTGEVGYDGPTGLGSPDGVTAFAAPAPPPPPVQHATADFDGDGSSDLSVFRPSAGKWYVDKSSGGSSTVAWGNATDIPVPGDYDGDGTTDVAVYRPSSGKWLIQDSGGGTQTVAWGNATDIPVPGDYNGDGKTDVAVYRPSSGKWLIEDSGGGTQTIAWGNATDIPVPGDYNGDGKTDVAVYRPSSGKWLIQDSGGGTQTIAWGNATDIPVPGDYDSDGKTDIAVFRPSSGKWLIDKSAGGTQTVAFGAASDIPVPGDYNGDGKTDIAVFRASSGKWYVNGGATTSWGTHGDIPAEVPPATYQHYFAS